MYIMFFSQLPVFIFFLQLPIKVRSFKLIKIIETKCIIIFSDITKILKTVELRDVMLEHSIVKVILYYIINLFN